MLDYLYIYTTFKYLQDNISVTSLEEIHQKPQTIEIVSTNKKVEPESEQTNNLRIKVKDNSKMDMHRKDVVNIDQSVTIESLDNEQLDDTEPLSTTKLTHVCTCLHIFITCMA